MRRCSTDFNSPNRNVKLGHLIQGDRRGNSSCGVLSIILQHHIYIICPARTPCKVVPIVRLWDHKGSEIDMWHPESMHYPPDRLEAIRKRLGFGERGGREPTLMGTRIMARSFRTYRIRSRVLRAPNDTTPGILEPMKGRKKCLWRISSITSHK